MNAGDLAALRICERAGCGYTIPNGITDLGQILLAMQNHAMIGHPVSGGSEEGGGKVECSNTTIGRTDYGGPVDGVEEPVRALASIM